MGKSRKILFEPEERLKKIVLDVRRTRRGYVLKNTCYRIKSVTTLLKALHPTKHYQQNPKYSRLKKIKTVSKTRALKDGIYIDEVFMRELRNDKNKYNYKADATVTKSSKEYFTQKQIYDVIIRAINKFGIAPISPKFIVGDKELNLATELDFIGYSFKRNAYVAGEIKTFTILFDELMKNLKETKNKSRSTGCKLCYMGRAIAQASLGSLLFEKCYKNKCFPLIVIVNMGNTKISAHCHMPTKQEYKDYKTTAIKYLIKLQKAKEKKNGQGQYHKLARRISLAKLRKNNLKPKASNKTVSYNTNYFKQHIYSKTPIVP